MATSTSLRNKVAIVGVGESDIGKVPNQTGLGLNVQAARRAIVDAGLKPSDIDGLLTAYSYVEPYQMLGSALCEYTGIRPRMAASMVVGGASPGVMLHHAATSIAMGLAETVLVCAGENRATGLGREGSIAMLTNQGHPQFERPFGGSIPAGYAMVARRYMHEFGITREQLAAVAVNTRAHALLKPNAQMKTPLTIEDVLASKPIADPLRMLDCCIISDAAGAFIVTSAERAQDLKHKPAYLLGIGEMHTHEHIMCAPSFTHFGAAESGRMAFEMAGVGPKDMDLAQLYDCFTIVPIIELEELGFVEQGAGGQFFLDGHARIGGKLPINTHGGMLSQAHAGAAGALLGIVESVRQLRGTEGARQVKDARLALVHNEGGILSSHCTMIFSNQKG
ncbi:MAG TPA: thiolase family protein [Ramlibacter sp.]|nr:thiolase family protein [Ramlibacter sp.]